MKHVGFSRAFGAVAVLVLASECGSSGGGGGSLSCFSVVGTGSSRTCAWSRTSNQSSCPSDSQEGSCPSTMLVGCCITPLTTSEETQTLAACVYSTAEEAKEKAICTLATETWQTTAP
jgi:hypothetical protein